MIYAIHGTACAGKTAVANTLTPALVDAGRRAVRVDGISAVRELVGQCVRAAMSQETCASVLSGLIPDDAAGAEVQGTADSLCELVVTSAQEMAQRKSLGSEDDDEESSRLDRMIAAALLDLAMILALNLPQSQLVERTVRVCLELNSSDHDVVLDDPPDGVLEGLADSGVGEREMIRVFLDADRRDRVSRAFARDGRLPTEVMLPSSSEEAELWESAQLVIDSTRRQPASVCAEIIECAQMWAADEPDTGMDIETLTKDHRHTITATLSYFDETAREQVLATLARQYEPERFVLDVARSKGIDVSDPAAVLSFSMQGWSEGAMINSTFGPDEEPVLITLEDSGRDPVTLGDVAISLGDVINRMAAID